MKLKKVIMRRKVAQPAGGDLPGTDITADTASQAEPEMTLETLDLSEGEQREIESEDDVMAVGISMPFTHVHPFDATSADSGGDAWGIADIGADALDENAGADVKVAVLDTGIDANHPAFDGLDPIIRNFTDEADTDVNGHGTHCAGTIFGQDVGGRRIGIARGVRQPLIGKVLGAGGGDSETIMNAMLWARENGAQVVSMSLGMDFPGFRERLVAGGVHRMAATSVALQAYRDNVRMFDKIADLFANSAIAPAPLLIAAAGNESRRPRYTIATAPPATADGILSVGALDQSHQPADFSNTKPDCCAPGVEILSAWPGGGLNRLSGTSMATPHVAGIAAVEAAALQAGGAFTPDQLRTKVLGRTKAIPGQDRADVGMGRVVV